MNYTTKTDGGDLLLYTDDYFEPALIFDCGQCFRFDPAPDGSFEGVAFKKRLKIRKEKDFIRFFDTTESDLDEVWKDFFDLDRDYRACTRDITEHAGKYRDHVALAAEKGAGIRLLRQDPWETLCSFIISQNNNIPRIKKLVEALCRECGERIDSTHYAFPTPRAVRELGEERLKEMKFGFRAGYIADAAERVDTGKTDLSSLYSLGFDEASAELEKIKGVGKKVASCTLLFGFSKLDAFPIDVWIKKVIDARFGGELPDLGEYRGLAQQYLFYYERYL
ncbi:MAG: DNA-3-methyladenine glycosylase 2 family protein [Clostridia bacterium]|nr:DNA-3-methyladenine glycosylase 2 family protein [Clostridia bacterium]